MFGGHPEGSYISVLVSGISAKMITEKVRISGKQESKTLVCCIDWFEFHLSSVQNTKQLTVVVMSCGE